MTNLDEEVAGAPEIQARYMKSMYDLVPSVADEALIIPF